MPEYQMTSLTEGVHYDASTLRLVGWMDQDGLRHDTPAIDHNAYFDDDGTYFGPDDDGVEPLFDPSSVARLGGDPLAEIEAVLIGYVDADSEGVSTSDMAAEWHSYGFTSGQVDQWVRVGIIRPNDADRLRVSQILPQQVAVADDILATETGHYVSLHAISEGDIDIERLIEVAKTVPVDA